MNDKKCHNENFHNFESYEDANRNKNLICLCRSCHIEEEMSDGSTL